METRGGRKGPGEQRERMNMIRRKVLLLMREKVNDAHEDVRLARIQFYKAKKLIWLMIPRWSRVGFEIQEVLRLEMSWEWEERYEKMQRSVKFLIQMHRSLRKEKAPALWRGIKINDQALGDPLVLPPPLLGGGVGEISDPAKEVLQLPPKTAVFAKFRIDISRWWWARLWSVDAKARWTDMELEERERSRQTLEEAQEEERSSREVYSR